MYYMEGFMIRHAFEPLLQVARHAKLEGKDFVLNLSSVDILDTCFEQIA
jgi:hypothetical protein